MAAERPGGADEQPEPDRPEPADPPSHELTVNVADELVGLAEQHAQGAVSDSDFTAKRDDLLG
jgi:hypothetical protein